MNESAGEETTEYLEDVLPLRVSDTLDPAEDGDADEEPALAHRREGLPPGFRMRHDAHYVEELMSGPADRPGAYDLHDRSSRSDLSRDAVPSERLRKARTTQPAPGAAFDLIASRMESAVAHAALARTPHAPGSLAMSVQAEFTRISRLARAAALLHGDDAPRVREIAARDVAAAARAACGQTARLAGLECDVTVDDPAFTLSADRALIGQAIAGTIDALAELIGADVRLQRALEAEGVLPRAAVNLQSVKMRPALIVEVVCPALPVADRHADHFFDNLDEDYRAAPAAGILLAAAAHAVRAHRGRADVKRHNGSGVTITFVLPQSAADAALA